MKHKLSYRSIFIKSILTAALGMAAFMGQAQSTFGFEDNTVNGWAGTASTETAAVNSAAANVRTGTYSLKLTTTSTGTGNKQWYSNTPYLPSSNNVYIHYIYWAKGDVAGTSVDGSFRYSSTAPPSGTGSSSNASNDFALSTTSWRRVINNVSSSSARFYFPGPRKTVSVAATSFYMDDGLMYTSLSSTTDTAKPLPPSAVAGTVSGNLITLNWASNIDTGTGATGVAATIILRTTNTAATAPDFNDQAQYSLTGGNAGPNTIGSWTIVNLTTGGTATSYLDAAPSPTAYKYAVVLRDGAQNYSVAAMSPSITAGLPVPTLFVNQTNFNNNFGSTVKGQTSGESNFTISGLNLTAPVVITAPVGFEVSQTTGAGFGSTVSLPQTSGAVAATTIFVHYKPTAATGATGPLNITNVSGPASTNVPVSGNAVDVEPTTNGSISFGTVRSTRIAVNLPTVGGGSKRIIVVSPGIDVSFIPVDGIAPAGVNADFSAATDQGAGNKIVYDGNGMGNDVVLVTGLTPGTTYYFAVYEYNQGTGTSQNYLPNSPITAIARTADNDLSVGNENTASVKVFPNPASSKVFISSASPVSVQIRSMDGRVVVMQQNAKEVALDGIAAGMYLLQVIDAQGQLVKTERLAVIK